MAACSGWQHRISLIRTTPLGVELSAPTPVPLRTLSGQVDAELQVVNTDGCDRVFLLLLGHQLCVFSDDLALVTMSDLGSARPSSIAATSTALAVGCPGKVLLLHAGAALSRLAERDLCEAECNRLAYIKSTNVILAAMCGSVHFIEVMRSDLTIVRRINFPGQLLAVMPWQLLGRCRTAGNTEAQLHAVLEPEALALAHGKGKGKGGRPRDIELVEHDEPPAHIPPEEAACTSAQLWASGINTLSRPSPAVSTVPRRPKVLLTFSRSSLALDRSLLASSPAEVARAEGIDVQPEGARGMKVFVAGFGPEHLEPPFLEEAMPRQVVLYKDDVDDLLAELSHLPYEIRKVKPTGALPEHPDALSFFGTSSLGASIEMGSAGPPAADLGSVAASSEAAPAHTPLPTLWVEVLEVRNTFVDFHAAPADERLARSAPP